MSKEHYAIIAKDKNDVQSFARSNYLNLYQYTWVQSPIQLKDLFDTTVVFIKGWSTNLTSQKFIDSITEAAYWCGKRPSNHVRMVHSEERIRLAKDVDKETLFMMNNRRRGDNSEEYY